MARLDAWLPSRYAIYIPTGLINKADVRAALGKLNSIAGGATLAPARGEWLSGDDVVREGVEVVSWWTNRQHSHRTSEFMTYLHVLIDLLLQHGEEAVMVEHGFYAHIYKE